ncbi:hypothetical protein GKR59_07760 [Providencia alcalifaciens]|uniref:Uncharacterized protein n=2 Tax=Morganellaceae TaxID=1903414 RepID=A0AAV3M964_9GAMM|nr:hypothetical protein HMPREF1564_3504 [Providencia alcalifaciens R90-1475]EUD11939.1 hypothetical protein HMPREF1563_1257 [Providencia alcalifaciens 205/92]MTC17249.1 hypothetical protein [Providencia alcalifaciens]MTC30731.1 hypothetical protein [Providencia alcalifaciens]MTC49540.1 hypothetical protein [Providencia alcalifaciens]
MFFMNINLNVLENAISSIFEEMKKNGIESVKLDSDFYWNVPSDALYDVYNEPKLDVGQLEDDYDALLKAKGNEILVRYNLKNIAAILRYLAEKEPN